MAVGRSPKIRGGSLDDRRAAVFLDKDGTLVVDVPYNVALERIRLTDRALEGLQALHSAGYLLIVVSNQSGVARGLFQERALKAVEAKLRMLLDEAGVLLAGFYYCPHHPDGSVERYAVDCRCRKPAAGMIEQAACEHGIDLTRSWLVGDILHDIEAGRRAGCRTVLLDVGHETEWDLTPDRAPHHTADDLAGAARVILAAGTSSVAPGPGNAARPAPVRFRGMS